MSEARLPWDPPEDLFEDAPCGYVATDIDGTILKVNRTFETLAGIGREKLLAGHRFQQLLAPGGRIYYETHYFPLLQMQGEVRGISVEIVRAGGSRLPVLLNSVLHRDDHGEPSVIRTTVFDATDRQAYENELRSARRREQEIAERLQRSLLSGEMPTAPGLDVGVAYRPGVSGLSVGGDWYDAFWLDEPNVVALVVGDVVGRGLEAAASMGQMRSAVRALASTGLGPAALLEALDHYADRHSVGAMTTLVYAQLDLATASLCFACAGHPPPLVVSPDEQPRFISGGRSLPLNTHLGKGGRDEVTVELNPRGTVLLYTDGLTDRPGVLPEESVERTLAAVDTHRYEATSDRLAGGVVRALHDAEHIDDVCVLVARLGFVPKV